MDGHTLTLRLPANNLDTLHQVCIRKLRIFNNAFIPLSYSDVSYTRTQRTRSTSSSSYSLPFHMTLVGCYSTNTRLTDCTYHEFLSSTATSMDISISCGSNTTDNNRSGNGSNTTGEKGDGSGGAGNSVGSDNTNVDSSGLSNELNSFSVASLSIAVFCTFAVFILAVLVIKLMLKQKKKKAFTR